MVVFAKTFKVDGVPLEQTFRVTSFIPRILIVDPPSALFIVTPAPGIGVLVFMASSS